MTDYTPLSKLSKAEVPDGYMCHECGVFVFRKDLHDEHHSHQEELVQIRKELAVADALSQGVSERAAAAVRLAEASLDYFTNVVVTPGESRAMREELSAAMALWRRLRG